MPLKVVCQAQTFFEANHEKMPGWFGPEGNKRKQKTGASEHFTVIGSYRRTTGIPFVQTGELYPQKGCLELIQTRIVSFYLVMVLDLRSIVSEHANPCSDIVVIGDNRAAISDCAKVLARGETKAGRRSQWTCTSPLITCAVGLGSILDHAQAVCAGQIIDRV